LDLKFFKYVQPIYVKPESAQHNHLYTYVDSSLNTPFFFIQVILFCLKLY